MSDSTLRAEQVRVLMKPLHPSRIKTLDGLSYLASWDVRAHLIRVFGYAQWSEDVTDCHLLYEQETTTRAGKPAFKVAYRATVRLTIHATGATYTEAAAGESVMPDFKRGDAHDMAIKTAESQAFKRCAMNLGTQYGLGLYDNGNTEDVVKVLVGGNDLTNELEAEETA